MSITEENHEIPYKTQKRNTPNTLRYNSYPKNPKRNGKGTKWRGDYMSWEYACIEDPTDSMDEDEEYMFDEYIDMMIDRMRGHD